MKIKTEFRQGRLRVRLCGELDHHAAKGVIRAICEEIDAKLPSNCVIDMKDVVFMDSSGIAVILKAYKRMKELGGTIYIQNAGKQIRRVLDISGIAKIISLEEINA